MKPIITVEGVSKRYTIGRKESYGSLRDEVMDALSSPFRRLFGGAESAPDPSVWALKDVSFEVFEGDVLGIIGRNGAGKSTLLKILSRITEPTEGRIEMRGRIASLLEVGTGFHPELTGRENIFMNGTLLGMSSREIKAKFDEIVAFSEIEKFLDTPVKRYSSGMYVRLAFAVAAHLEPEILIIDEVLAVGDSLFQKKCLGKMGEVAKGGRTVLFVSHNMAAVENLCNRAVLVDKGVLIKKDETKKVIDCYLKEVVPFAVEGTPLADRKDRSGNGFVKFTGFHIEDEKGCRLKAARSGMNICFVFEFISGKAVPLSNVDVGFSIHSMSEQLLFVLYTSYVGQTFEKISHSGKFKCILPALPLVAGRYRVGARITVNGEEADWPSNGIGYLDVEAGDFFGTGHQGFEKASFLMSGTWNLTK